MAHKQPQGGTALEPRPLNNAQRKALSEIVDKRLGAKVDSTREQERDLERGIIMKLVKRFKVDAIQNQIDKLEKDIKNLKDMRDDLGFSQDYDGGFRVTGGEAQKLLEAEVKDGSVTIRRLEDTRDALKQHIWLAQSVEEARQVVQQIDGL